MTRRERRRDILLTGDVISFANELACVLGCDREAQILQQVFWWVEKAEQDGSGRIGKFEDGRWWAYQEMHEWRRRFGYLSGRTLQRKRKSLEDKGVLLRKDEVDPKALGGVRVWYSIDYDRLEKLREAYYASLEEDEDDDIREFDEDDETSGEDGLGVDKLSSPIDVELGYDSLSSPPPKPHDKTEAMSRQTVITFTNKHKQTSTNIHNGSAAPPADAVGAGSPHDAAPLKQKQTQSYIQSVKGKGPRDRTKEKPGRTGDENGKRRVNPAELTELGKLIVHLSGKGTRNKIPTKSLTENQARRLDTEVEFFYGDEKITITPNELYDREPKMLRQWLEKVVHPKLYGRYAKKRGYVLGRDMLINVLTLEGSDGYDIRSYYEWRKKAQYKNWESVVPDEEIASPPTGEGTVQVAVMSDEEFAAIFGDDETERSVNDNDEQE